MSSRNISPSAISTRFVLAFAILQRNKVVGTKKDFCISIGMKPQNFHPIEIGERGASLSNLCALVEEYNVSPVWLFTGEGEVFRGKC